MSIVLSLHKLCTSLILEGTSSFVQMEGAMNSGRKKPVLPDATESILACTQQVDVTPKVGT